MGSLFIVGARITLRGLEVIPVAGGQAAVGENTFPNSFRPDFGKWWKFSNCSAEASGRSTRRLPYGRHGAENGEEDRQNNRIIRLE